MRTFKKDLKYLAIALVLVILFFINGAISYGADLYSTLQLRAPLASNSPQQSDSEDYSGEISSGLTRIEKAIINSSIPSQSEGIKAKYPDIVKVADARSRKLNQHIAGPEIQRLMHDAIEAAVKSEKKFKNASPEAINIEVERQMQLVLSSLEDVGANFNWFESKIWSSKKYYLGDNKALAADIIGTLLRLETEEAKDLVDEYILHEALEGTSLGHYDIIRLTSRIFNRPMSEQEIEAIGPSHAGVTPLGKALRRIITNKVALKGLPMALFIEEIRQIKPTLGGASTFTFGAMISAAIATPPVAVVAQAPATSASAVQVQGVDSALQAESQEVQLVSQKLPPPAASSITIADGYNLRWQASVGSDTNTRYEIWTSTTNNFSNPNDPNIKKYYVGNNGTQAWLTQNPGYQGTLYIQIRPITSNEQAPVIGDWIKVDKAVIIPAKLNPPAASSINITDGYSLHWQVSAGSDSNALYEIWTSTTNNFSDPNDPNIKKYYAGNNGTQAWLNQNPGYQGMLYIQIRAIAGDPQAQIAGDWIKVDKAVIIPAKLNPPAASSITIADGYNLRWQASAGSDTNTHYEIWTSTTNNFSNPNDPNIKKYYVGNNETQAWLNQNPGYQGTFYIQIRAVAGNPQAPIAGDWIQVDKSVSIPGSSIQLNTVVIQQGYQLIWTAPGDATPSTRYEIWTSTTNNFSDPNDPNIKKYYTANNETQTWLTQNPGYQGTLYIQIRAITGDPQAPVEGQWSNVITLLVTIPAKPNPPAADKIRIENGYNLAWGEPSQPQPPITATFKIYMPLVANKFDPSVYPIRYEIWTSTTNNFSDPNDPNIKKYYVGNNGTQAWLNQNPGYQGTLYIQIRAIAGNPEASVIGDWTQVDRTVSIPGLPIQSNTIKIQQGYQLTWAAPGDAISSTLYEIWTSTTNNFSDPNDPNIKKYYVGNNETQTWLNQNPGYQGTLYIQIRAITGDPQAPVEGQWSNTSSTVTIPAKLNPPAADKIRIENGYSLAWGELSQPQPPITGTFKVYMPLVANKFDPSVYPIRYEIWTSTINDFSDPNNPNIKKYYVGNNGTQAWLNQNPGYQGTLYIQIRAIAGNPEAPVIGDWTQVDRSVNIPGLPIQSNTIKIQQGYQLTWAAPGDAISSTLYEIWTSTTNNFSDPNDPNIKKYYVGNNETQTWLNQNPGYQGTLYIQIRAITGDPQAPVEGQWSGAAATTVNIPAKLNPPVAGSINIADDYNLHWQASDGSDSNTLYEIWTSTTNDFSDPNDPNIKKYYAGNNETQTWLNQNPGYQGDLYIQIRAIVGNPQAPIAGDWIQVDVSVNIPAKPNPPAADKIRIENGYNLAWGELSQAQSPAIVPLRYEIWTSTTNDFSDPSDPKIKKYYTANNETQAWLNQDPGYQGTLYIQIRAIVGNPQAPITGDWIQVDKVVNIPAKLNPPAASSINITDGYSLHWQASAGSDSNTLYEIWTSTTNDFSDPNNPNIKKYYAGNNGTQAWLNQNPGYQGTLYIQIRAIVGNPQAPIAGDWIQVDKIVDIPSLPSRSNAIETQYSL